MMQILRKNDLNLSTLENKQLLVMVDACFSMLTSVNDRPHLSNTHTRTNGYDIANEEQVRSIIVLQLRD